MFERKGAIRSSIFHILKMKYVSHLQEEYKIERWIYKLQRKDLGQNVRLELIDK